MARNNERKTKKRRRSTKAHSKGRGNSGSRRSPVVTRAVTRRRLAQRAAAQRAAAQRAAAQTPLRMKSYVYITGPRQYAANAVDRVGQVVATNRDKSKYAVRLNYNGQIMIMKREHLRKATAAEKRADKKEHNRESPLNRIYLEQLHNRVI